MQLSKTSELHAFDLDASFFCITTIELSRLFSEFISFSVFLEHSVQNFQVILVI